MIIRIVNEKSGEVKEISCDDIQYAFEVYHFDRTVHEYDDEDFIIEILDDDKVLYSGYEMVECVRCGREAKKLNSVFNKEKGNYICDDCYIAMCEDQQDYLLRGLAPPIL